MTSKQIIRLKLRGVACRSAERLVVLKAEAIEGVRAAAYDAMTSELIALVDTTRVGRDDLVAAAVSAGLVPDDEPVMSALTPDIGGYYVP